MPNGIYDHADDMLLTAQVDWVGDDFTVIMVDETYVFDPADVYRSDIGGTPEIDSAALTGKTVANGAADADDVVSMIVPLGRTLRGLIICRDTGVDATSELINYIDTNEDTLAINRAGTGEVVPVAWSNGSGRILALDD